MAMVNSPHRELHLEIIQNIGAGSFATVKKVRYKQQIVAAKIFDRPTKSNDGEFQKEVQQLKRLNHDNIIKIIDYGKYKDRITIYYTILLEFADLGSLESLLHDDNKNHLNYSLGHAVNWLYQIAGAINYLHSYNPRPIIHRDLKPLNLLLMQGGKIIKICDFGTTCDIRSIMTVDKGTPLYIAPEVLTEKNYNEKCDVYSYGIILWELFSRKKPYFDKKFNSMQTLLAVKEGLRPPKISNCPKILSLLYERTIDYANRRPTISHIYKIFEYLNRIINIVPLSPLIPLTVNTPTTPRSYFSSTESIAGRQIEKSPFTTVIINNGTNHERLPPRDLHLDDDNDGNCFIRNVSTRNSVHSFLPKPNDNNNITANHIILDNNLGNSNINHRPSGHRRTRSHGYPKIDDIITDNSMKSINTNVPKSFNQNSMHEPLQPIKNHSESERIYGEHRQLLIDDENLQKQLQIMNKEKEDLEKLLKCLESKKKLENELKILETQLKS